MKAQRLLFLVCMLLWGWLLPSYSFAGYPQIALSDLSTLSAELTETESDGPVAVKKKTVYFISGLAADKRLFDNVTLPANINVKHVAWLEPKKAETLESYCRRLATQIDTTADFSLVGISFGGMIAVEMNKFLKPEKTILISSITTSQSFSGFFKTVNNLHLHKVVPAWFYKHFYRGAYWFFDPQTEEQRQLIVALMDNASENLLTWSIDQLICWENEFIPENAVIIAGNKDRVFPHKKLHPDHLIPGGTHMMVFDKGREVSRVLDEILNEPAGTNLIAIRK